MIRVKKPFAVLVGVLAMGSCSAQAADTDAQVRELFLKGNTLYESGKKAEAEAAYEEAFALRQTHDLATNLAAVEVDLGKYLEALAHLRFALDTAPAGGSLRRKAEMKAAYATALTKVGLLKITVVPSDATVVSDGPLAVTLPEGLAVQPGERVVRVSKVGFVTREERVTVAAGEGKELKVALEADKTPALAPTAASSASVPSPPATSSPPAKEEPSLVPSLIAGGVGVALLGAGIGLRLAANGAESDAMDERARLQSSGVACDRDPGACATLADAAESHDSLGTTGDWLLVGAGAAAGTAVLLWIWPFGADDMSRSQTTLVPVVTATGTGAVWTGHF